MKQKIDEQQVLTDPLNDEHSADQYVNTDPAEIRLQEEYSAKCAAAKARIYAELARLAEEDK